MRPVALYMPSATPASGATMLIFSGRMAKGAGEPVIA
jgi:hypothetical protein